MAERSERLNAVPVAGYSGFEGWAEIEEWRGFAAELARSLGTSWVERGAAASS